MSISRLSVPPTMARSYGLYYQVFSGWNWLGVALATIVALAWPLVVSRYWLHLSNLALIAIIGAIGLNLLCGNARLISLGQAAFLGIGGFAASIFHLRLGAPFPVAVLGAVVCGAVVGFIISIPSLRLKAIYVAITTLALHFVFVTIAAIYQAEAVRNEGIVMPVPSLFGLTMRQNYHWYFLLLALATFTMFVGVNIRRTFVGRRWMAVADHEVAASALGVRIARAKMSAFVVSSAIVAGAGALAAYYEGVVTAEAYNLHLAVSYLAMIIVGGIGSVLGSVIGAVFITLLPYGLDQVFAWLKFGVGGNLNGLHSMVYGLLIVVFMLFEPLGLAEVYRRIRHWIALWPMQYRG